MTNKKILGTIAGIILVVISGILAHAMNQTGGETPFDIRLGSASAFLGLAAFIVVSSAYGG